MLNHKRIILSGMKILHEQKWLEEHAIIIEGGKFKAILPATMTKHHMPATVYHYADDCYAVPGFMDLHVHGANGYDVMDGTEQSLTNISEALAAEGVTGYLATTLTASDAELEKVLTCLPAAKLNKRGAAILGVHLEGPFIANNKLGAHKNLAQLPDSKLIHKWQTLSDNNIKIVTLAPELPGAIEFIRELRNMGIIASIGHTNASYDETMRAISAGCTQATHLFNAMRGIHQREPGAAGALLLAHTVSAELIVDDHHLHPAIVDLVWRLKGLTGLYLVTDAMRAKCMPEGEYDLGGQAVAVKANKATLADGTLAGSTLRMPQAIQNMMAATSCSLKDAIDLATTNPACALGLRDSKGEIEVNKDADLVILDEKFNVLMTLREGIEIYKA